ncbi:MAG: hypothetical protein Q9P14_16420 [candidate division KSB1 bacterium]|nr:hypothetical protein [candidate division KSB1 bacterium]MDQ7062800.1 hypothetical protein [candidate division KSB1 bacterium]
MGEKKAHDLHHQDSGGYEKQDINIKSVFGWAVLSIVAIAAMVVFLVDYFVVEKEKEVYKSVLQPESQKLMLLRITEEDVLNNYAVIDANKGIYRIPIDSAMKILAKESEPRRGRR